MSPPAGLPAPQSAGGSTPSRAGSQVEATIRAAHRAFADAGITVSPRRINRLVRRCLGRVHREDVTFQDALTEAANLSFGQRRRVFANPELARCISYADPTGEDAARNVDLERAGRRIEEKEVCR